jgi:hypothetical protein
VVERLLEDLLVDAHLSRDLPQRPARGMGLLDDLGGAVVADVAWRSSISSFGSIPLTHFSSSVRDAAASSLIESSRLRAISGTRTLSSNWPWLPAIVIAASLPIT